MTLKSKTILRYLLMLGLGMLLGWMFFVPPHVETAEHEHEFVPTETAEGTIWTCSMHPQVRQNEAGQCPICGMDLIRLESSSDEEESSNPYQLTMSADAVKLANVQTTKIGTTGTYAEDSKELLLNGKIELDETRIKAQTAHFSGRVEKMYITYEGEKVSHGQIIALIYSPQLVSAQQELLEAKKFQESNPSLFAAAKRKLKNWKLSDAQVEQVIENEKIISYWPLRAHASGVVTSIDVETGEHVMEGSVIYEAADLTQLWAVFDAYESNLNWIKAGGSISFSVAAYPDREFTSEITFVDPFIDPQSRVAKVRTEVRNADGLLKPAMFVRGRLSNHQQNSLVSDQKDELLVPKSAVMWTGKRSVVYVKVPQTNVPTYEMREVTLGASLGDTYLVEEGLSSGEEVVTNGTFTVDAAAQLNNKSSMMNRNIQVKSKETSPREMNMKTPDFVMVTPKAFREQLQNVLADYLALKDALVISEKEQAQQKAEALQASLQKVDMQLLPHEPHMYWMERLEEIKASAEEIIGTGNIDTQRKNFKSLSSAVIQAARAFGTAEKLYVQYCPMADDDEGANWLSQSEEIRNPYYGDMMLNCGNVENILNP
ncbi:Cu(I)/Ag(I) efflux system membrane fusion protein [Catalinimonas alkaloidigena]|uniref:efflux RND transporter periplasmic adaptor subunit n=1 Tax=Catalinimonas alkaloidigena TaxID=1075417 RepID=UPI002405EAF4|nr:efflux RND transporter periplasmic adaptor subunit [Catalinimonas alkaloidigena]MDF9795630.1 Cu(I)/Ag(I) efflux system membrane fusion protein [Catalinimonas alkaloidigena]